MLTQRRRTPELMDDPSVDRRDLARSLRFIRMVNRRLGGTSACLGQFKRWSREWSGDDPIGIIDLGTGSADIPLAIVRWARRVGHRVRITAVDSHPTTLAVARAHVGERADIDLVQADALKLMDRYEPGAFDYAHAGMFLHHLDDIEVMTMLRLMDRLTTRGLIWNDLVRGTLEKLVIRLLTVGRPPMVRHDAIGSVAAGFTKQEALELAGRVDLAGVVYRRHLGGRFTVVSSKKGLRD
ncbi:MAG: methyltransferase domain-containing protein [Planctomycetota bacterium]|jgi:hypothetical protein